ncbi:acetate/propionate family kinase [Paenibacillus ginsengarvi]|uniref:Acetate kinase n=1 Tax=Paenibacillus ginsengarvi TaxID=400777 RepID=A0A3B0BIQ0_9BACL|nr:acetate kinase [Paenibacillus ginsengarvi]RKN72428.1 acetate kinase [Paenibacillus ginsengarvi]
MNILVINAGSSSLKYQLFDMITESVLAKGKVERIGMETAMLSHEPAGRSEFREVSEIWDHTTAIRKVLRVLIDPKEGVLTSMEDVHAVGHRVVHGGESFSGSVLVDERVKAEIRRLFDLAPLHNPGALTGILAVEANLPHVPQVVVFDTAFHQTMPPVAFRYAIPNVFYKKHGVRRYGFHGTSHQYVSQRAAELSGKPIETMKLITCHIGNGASVTAIKHGQSVDTSMGMTPLEGLMMGTRSGDIDPAIVPFAMDKEDLSVNEVNSMLNKHSGLFAVSGGLGDMREVLEAMKEGDRNARLAFDMYEYRLRKYIGAYAAAMNGFDTLIFTAGVGENSALLREVICSQLSYLGLTLDTEANERKGGGDRKISSPDSKVDVWVIPTNEELVIARDTFREAARIRGLSDEEAGAVTC